ncbi:hypothetical protein QJQ45_006935 [Haematococcus lacustris]|nr:hypothetical protein QJQ45_006935 [Haematococcus lacustris]
MTDIHVCLQGHLASRQAATKGSTHAVPSSIDDSEGVAVEQAGGKSKDGRTLLGDSYAPAHAPAHPSKGSNQASASASAQASSSGDGKSKASAKAKADSKSKGGRLLLTDLSGSTAPAYTPAHPSKVVAFLEALNAAHHPLALYPPQQIRTDSFSQAFFDYLRAIDRLLSMPSLLQQRSDLQAQLPRGAFSNCPICALVPGVPQDGYEHCVAGDACNKPSRYAGVAKATRDLEQHTDTYLDRTGLEGAVQQLHDSGQLSLSGAFAAARATTEATGAGADAAVVSARLAGVDSQSGKDTRAASNAIKAKLRTARQLLKEAALYQALGTLPAAVSMVRGEPAPWAEASTPTPYGKLLHYGRQLHHLRSDRDRCVEQQAMLRIEHSRVLVWLQHMIVVCKGACSEPEAHGEAESGQLQQSWHIGRLFYIKQHMQQYQDMLIKG